MKSIFGLLTVGCATALWAHPADPSASSTVSNNGTELTITRFGDEHYNYATTQDGYLVVPNDSGNYVYADSNGNATSIIAHNLDQRTAKEKVYLNSMGENGRQRSLQKHRETSEDRFPDEESAPGALILRASASTPQNRPAPLSWTQGERYVPVLLIGTTDIPHADSAAIYDLLNKPGYSTNGNIGSLRDYYLHSSNGIMDIHFDVYPIQLPVAQTSFGSGSNFNEGNYLKTGVEALTKRADFTVNAPKYCFQGTKIDAFMFLFPGMEEDALKQSSNFWGHKYQMTSNGSTTYGSKGYTSNGYTFNDYLFIAQFRDKSNSTRLNAMGIFAHEFSHLLGLKDLYYGNSIGGPTPYDVMTRGMYNGDKETPPAFSAFERESVGWMTIPEVSADSIHVIRDLSKMEAYSITNPNHPDEYYVVEYRPAVKYDAYIKDNGVYIWYIDYNAIAFENNSLNKDASHQRVAMQKVLKSGYYANFTYVNKSGTAPIPGIYNITLEGDSLACFATNSTLTISKCPAASPLSSSSESISSSTEISSSSFYFGDISSSSLAPESSSDEAGIAPRAVAKVLMHMDGATLHLSCENEHSKSISVFDMLGNKIMSESFSGKNYSLYLGDIPHRSYMIQVSEKGNILAQKRISTSRK